MTLLLLCLKLLGIILLLNFILTMIELTILNFAITKKTLSVKKNLFLFICRSLHIILNLLIYFYFLELTKDAISKESLDRLNFLYLIFPLYLGNTLLDMIGRQYDERQNRKIFIEGSNYSHKEILDTLLGSSLSTGFVWPILINLVFIAYPPFQDYATMLVEAIL